MHYPWVLLALEALIVSPVLASSGTVFINPQIRITTSFDFNARIMDHWGGGGGRWEKIKDPKHPFQGRWFGGAKRREIRGTRAFGSGYPYGVNNHSTVAGRPLPFGVWPLYWDQNFMESGEYGPERDVIRPGGLIAMVPLRTTTEYFNLTDNEVYYAIADRESLLPLMVSYVTSCHVAPAWPSKFDPLSPNTMIKLENVIQYFRGSSFALASRAYNNIFSRIPTDTVGSTPLPDFIEYSPFRKCIDAATENALAIVNKMPEAGPVDKFVVALRVGAFFVIGGMIAVLILLWHLLLIVRKAFQAYLYGEHGVVQHWKKKWYGDPIVIEQ
ncbi:hypothetical protein FRC17_002694, partial [Serendipita sp. 399]